MTAPHSYTLKQAAEKIRDAFTYDPGHSDLDNEQPITIHVTLGDWRKLNMALASQGGPSRIPQRYYAGDERLEPHPTGPWVNEAERSLPSATASIPKWPESRCPQCGLEHPWFKTAATESGMQQK